MSRMRMPRQVPRLRQRSRGRVIDEKQLPFLQRQTLLLEGVKRPTQKVNTGIMGTDQNREIKHRCGFMSRGGAEESQRVSAHQMMSAKPLSIFRNCRTPNQRKKPINAHADKYSRHVKRALPTKNAPAKAVDHSHHGIERIKQAPLRGYYARTEAYRRNIKTELHDERNDVTKVSVFYVKRGDPKRWADAGKERQDDEDRQNRQPPVRHEAIPAHQREQYAEAD